VNTRRDFFAKLLGALAFVFAPWSKRAKASASAPKGGAGVFPFPPQEKTSKRRIRIHKTYPCDPPSRLTTLYCDMAHKKGEVDVSQFNLEKMGQ